MADAFDRALTFKKVAPRGYESLPADIEEDAYDRATKKQQQEEERLRFEEGLKEKEPGYFPAPSEKKGFFEGLLLGQPGSTSPGLLFDPETFLPVFAASRAIMGKPAWPLLSKYITLFARKRQPQLARSGVVESFFGKLREVGGRRVADDYLSVYNDIFGENLLALPAPRTMGKGFSFRAKEGIGVIRRPARQLGGKEFEIIELPTELAWQTREELLEGVATNNRKRLLDAATELMRGKDLSTERTARILEQRGFKDLSPEFVARVSRILKSDPSFVTVPGKGVREITAPGGAKVAFEIPGTPVKFQAKPESIVRYQRTRAGMPQDESVEAIFRDVPSKLSPINTELITTGRISEEAIAEEAVDQGARFLGKDVGKITSKFKTVNFIARLNPASHEYYQIQRLADLQKDILNRTWRTRADSIWKGLEKWQKTAVANVLDSSTTHPDPKVMGRARQLRTLLNDVATKLGLPQNQRISNYFPHIFSPEGLKLALNKRLRQLKASQQMGRNTGNAIKDTEILLKTIEIEGYVPADVLDRLPRSAFFRNMLKRQAHLKFDFNVDDPATVLNAYFFGAARKSAFDPWLQQAPELLNQMPRELAAIMEQSTLSAIGIKTGLEGVFTSPLASKYARWATTIEALDKMAASTLSVFYNLTQTPTFTLAKAGGVNTVKAIRKLFTKEGQELVRRAGITLDAGSEAELAKGFVGTLSTVTDVGLYLFRKAEQFNRAVGFLAGREKALAEGFTNADDLLRAGVKMVDDTQFNYAMWNRPELWRSSVGRTLGQFKMFQTSALQFIYAMKPKEHARFWTASFLIGGPNVIPVMRMLKDTGVISDETWNEISRFSVSGQTGIDISYGPGIGTIPNILTETARQLPVDPEGAVKALPGRIAREFAGPHVQHVGQVMAKLMAAVTKTRALKAEDFLPIAFYRHMQGMQKDSQGNYVWKDRKGNVITRLTPAERLVALGGLTPERVREIQRATRIENIREIRRRKEKDLLTRKLLDARGDEKKLRLVVEEIEAWNRRAVGPPINPESILRKLQEIEQGAIARQIKRTPKKGRLGVIERLRGLLPSK